MDIINRIVISEEAPNLSEVGWLQPVDNGTFKLKFNGVNGWTDAASGIKGDTGDKGTTGAKGADGKSVKAIALVTNAEGKVTGGTCTLSDNSTIAITVTTA